jgi:hypothetical protein
MIEHSESLASLAPALAKAQGEVENAAKNAKNPHAEMPLVLAVADILTPARRRMGRRRKGESALERFYSGIVMGASDCWYWRKVRPLGYGACYMLGEVFAHRVSWRLHHGDIPAGMYVLHRCDVRNCVNPAHLFLGTKADNHRDMVEKGRQPRGYKKPNHTMRGEGSPRAKLSRADVAEIRRALADGESGAALARRYGVTRGAIYHIAKGRAWRDA